MPFQELTKHFSLKKLPKSGVHFEGEVPAETIEKYREEALRHIAEHLDIDGFRKGNVPPALAEKKVGEIRVLEEAVEMFARDFYPVLITEKKIDAVGRPDIRITKLAPGNPVALTIDTAVYPEVHIPKNWRSLADKVPAEITEEVVETEVEETLESLRKARAKANPASPDARPEGFREDILPELNDEFARSVGAFKDLDDLKAKIKEGIGEEKSRRARDKRRGAIIEVLVDKTEADMPDIFVESELDKIMSNLENDLSRMNLSVDDYLKRIGKDMSALREEFRDQALKRAKLQMLLNKLADDEKIAADAEEIESEMKHALEHFPDAKENLLRIHIETVLRNEKVLQMLEKTQK